MTLADISATLLDFALRVYMQKLTTIARNTLSRTLARPLSGWNN